MARTLVAHSTEGSTVAGAVATLRRNNSESNWVTDPETGEVVTLTDSERGDRSLRNRPGGVETNNRAGVWQVEIVGFATDIPHKPEYWFRRLGSILASLCEAKGIPKLFPYPFVAYPASYGLRASQRLTAAQWLTVDGIVGHQHVPENDHGDPGDISRVIPYVTGGDPAMPIQIEELLEQLLATDQPSLRDYDSVMNTVERLYFAYTGHFTTTSITAWGRDIAEKLGRREDIRPTLEFIEWKLREEHEAAAKAAGQ